MSTAAMRHETRQQRYLAQAYQHVQEMRERDQRTREVYGGLCHKLPVLLRANGLCQTLAFIQEKGSGADARAQAYRSLAGHMARVLNVDEQQLVDHVQMAATARYIADTRALLAAWVYYKRFAVSILKVEAGGDEEGR